MWVRGGGGCRARCRCLLAKLHPCLGECIKEERGRIGWKTDLYGFGRNNADTSAWKCSRLDTAQFDALVLGPSEEFRVFVHSGGCFALMRSFCVVAVLYQMNSDLG